MIEQSLIREWNLLVYAVLLGMGYAFFYDQFLVCRKIIKHHKLIIFLEDLLYLIFCFFISFYFLYYGNNGILRLYMVIGCTLGIILYLLTIGRVYQKGMCYFLNVVMYPFGVLKKRLTKVVIHFTIKLRKSLFAWKRKGEEHAAKHKKKNKAKVSKKKK